MDFKRQLLSIEAQMEMIKKPLHSLQDQKHKLTRGLHEQECELSHIITGTLNHDDKEDDVSKELNILNQANQSYPHITILYTCMAIMMMLLYQRSYSIQICAVGQNDYLLLILNS